MNYPLATAFQLTPEHKVEIAIVGASLLFSLSMCVGVIPVVVLLIAGYAAILLRHIYLNTFSKSHRLIQTAHRLNQFLKKFEPDCQAKVDFLMAFEFEVFDDPQTRTLVDHRQLMACFDQIDRQVDNELLTMVGMKDNMLAMAIHYHETGVNQLSLVAAQCAHIYDIKIEYLEALHAAVGQKTLEVTRIFRFSELVYQNTDISLVTEGKELDVCAICLDDMCEGKRAFVLLNCKHHFHADCFESWVTRQPVCPICKASVYGSCS
jgi:hypothetical protein